MQVTVLGDGGIAVTSAALLLSFYYRRMCVPKESTCIVGKQQHNRAIF